MVDVNKLSEEEITAAGFEKKRGYYTYRIKNTLVGIDDRGEKRTTWGFIEGKPMQRGVVEDKISAIFGEIEEETTPVLGKKEEETTPKKIDLMRLINIHWEELEERFVEEQREKGKNLELKGIDGDTTTVINSEGRVHKVHIGKDIAGCDCEDWVYRGNADHPCYHMIFVFDARSEEEKVKVKEDVEQKITAPATQAGAELEMIKETDRLDEEMITEQLKTAPAIVYEVHAQVKDKKTQTYKEVIKHELTWEGIVVAARRQGNLHVIDADIKNVNNTQIGFAKCSDVKRNIIMIGTAERYRYEEFRTTVLISKAIRNALKHLIIPKIKQDVIKEGLTAESVIILSGY